MNLSDKAAAKLEKLRARAKRAQVSMDRAITALERFYEHDLGMSRGHAADRARNDLA